MRQRKGKLEVIGDTALPRGWFTLARKLMGMEEWYVTVVVPTIDLPGQVQGRCAGGKDDGKAILIQLQQGNDRQVEGMVFAHEMLHGLIGALLAGDLDEETTVDKLTDLAFWAMWRAGGPRC